MAKHIVIIGNGMVSYKFCEKFKAQNSTSEYKITVIGEEVFPAYDRVHLSEYFSDRSVDNLTLAKPSWYKENGITLMTSTLVIKINADSKSVKTSQGEDIAYDVLVLATGSRPFIPSIEGVNKKGVFVYRTIDDLDAIIKYGEANKKYGKMKATVLGGGLLGLEAAKAVVDLGLETDVVEFAAHLMPRQLDKAGGEMLKEIIEALGIKIHCQKQTTRIEGKDSIEALRFIDDTILKTDMLVISAGIRSRQELADSCAIKLGPKGGFMVNNAMKTNLPNVYAIGEAASYQGMTYGLVAPGYDMAEVAVNQILGIDKLMEEQIDMSTKLKLIGTDVASFGEPFDTTIPSEKIVYENKHAGIYKRINISEDGKKLLGGILVGDAEDYNMLFQIYKNGLALPEDPVHLIIKPSDGKSSVGSVIDLPDEAIICSCESVSKGSICHAVMEQGCEDMKALVACTKATSGCGGCKPMVKDLQNAVLSQMGKEVKEIICEHFTYNRRELYDMIKVKGIKSYNEALDKVGHGHGCETCKPALASIFAGIYNETPVKQETIQDTNDRFLANIQRNGTYSVVPRVPGGEITADKLIALGEVAKKYDLYSKITGGQRIDLFGARVDQLPLIWKDLIDAGFESGHAYGKALRTVKSCVGSTWCRYGMDESVSFAIELENRYRGIRSPHKLKGGVSGCIRECAEARCKDFGLIATEEGWNLYVCGNGGANPKHAKLLAESIDNKSVVRYLDRFLMFYIKTAPPLTRTAKWLEQLDGGMDYLKQVVVEDSLGIADELELQMQALVNSFECEWKQVVESEELQKRYKHFVNSDDVDDNLAFVSMREQKMPKPWN